MNYSYMRSKESTTKFRFSCVKRKFPFFAAELEALEWISYKRKTGENAMIESTQNSR